MIKLRHQRLADGTIESDIELPDSGTISPATPLQIRRCERCGEVPCGDNFCGRCQSRVVDED